ncbi:hypothetical protein [Prescottella equi]|uniref:hypothetical protein n=1 Tax=Rhodococcus hoagii TaxID=43767 RepID=UPI00131ECF29|nr:hypothetical protein [Prescottella equi]
MTATVTEPDLVAGIFEISAYHTDDAGQSFATVVLENGDVVDADIIDVMLAAA